MKTIKFNLVNTLQDYSGYMDCTIGSHLFERLKKEKNEGQNYITIVLKTPELEKFIKNTNLNDYQEITEEEYNEFIGEEEFGFFSIDFQFINSACLPTSIEEVYNNFLKRYYKQEFVNIKNGQKTIAGNLFFVCYNNNFYHQNGDNIDNETYYKIKNIFIIK